ncbi:MAG TPA: PPOX class F420-dependent oxidoreductase [Pseudonocardiaceae bacterium]|jgi:pyridoxamine 5'-phosphate oxidase family protein
MTFTEPEIEYLAGQPLGRLATVSAAGDVQNNPVGFAYNADTQTIDIGGYSMGSTRKYRNVQATGQASLVVDDLVSRDPWQVRGIEVRGRAEALTGQTPSRSGQSGEIIRIHPRRILSWGIEPDGNGMQARNVPAPG